MDVGKHWQDVIYKESASRHPKYPFTNLVSLIKRNRILLDGKNVLELGCGVGPNVQFFLNEKANYIGCDYSSDALKEARSRFANIDFKECDLNSGLPFYKDFDVIFDRSAIPCIDPTSFKTLFAELSNILNEGAYFIGVDWFAEDHGCIFYSKPVYSEDGITMRELNDKGLVIYGNGMKYVNYFREKDIMNLMSYHKLDIINIEKRIEFYNLNEENEMKVSTYSFVARKVS